MAGPTYTQPPPGDENIRLGTYEHLGLCFTVKQWENAKVMVESTQLRFGFSPCPNDTFMFYALAHKKVFLPKIEFLVDLQDVESLNRLAATSYYDLTKVSIHAIAHLSKEYCLLDSGGAMGRGCGPLVLARSAFAEKKLPKAKVAIPGKYTTANLLLQLFTGGCVDVVPMPYDQIMESISRGEVDAGVIIHEGRFTYRERGLKKILDLGEWWEGRYYLPLPLGGILMKRDLIGEFREEVENLIRESISYAKKHRDEVWHYVKSNAQEMAEDVIGKHIGLYVNEYSERFGEKGRRAIVKLLDLGAKLGFVPRAEGDIFGD